MPNNLSKKQEQLQQAVKVLKQGGIVAIPTFTSYGLAVDARNEKAVKKLYALKGRSFNKPIHVIIPNISSAEKIVKFNHLAHLLAKKYWPGSLTIVLPLKAKGKSWKMLSAKTGTMGVREADYILLKELLEVFPYPITATSANLAGQPNTYSVGEIKKQFAKSKIKPDFYLDAGTLTRRHPSTMVQIDRHHVTLLREGPIKYHELLKSIHLNVSNK